MRRLIGNPTLSDVAEVAGVSTATVSRCLNAPERVQEETRKRVMEAVQALGYSPNFGARVLAEGRTHTVGAIIPTMDNAIFSRGLQAFQEELRESGLMLLIASSSYRPEIEEEQIRALVKRGAEGLLLIGFQRSDDVRAFLAAQQIPALVAWAWQPDAAQPCVGFDNHAAMAAMAREVIARGHRQLALISADPAVNDRALVRIEGLRAAMAAAGLDPATLVIETTDATLESGGLAFRRLWERPNRPTAVLCGTDVLAAGALTAARDLGVAVPDAVSITGFADLDIARITAPPLTTMHLPHRRMGREAARMLVRMIAGERVESRELDCSLVLRGTLAAPRDRETGQR
ncbi:LacI family DNA-binding transcriptional regulator [Seohaeicola zhoushanensis]|uniref:Transcriptional regulator n=1 Tax=Seohaeicola zhoushanensis TaxID=1569283 RepID=A0A8J3GW52_9RHOB|nr:LacI family DNA-binding transcriptional regulator [Seohaeicola zhoushanensis]GHF47030.1 transcriptional regulator [Seohaeicola zhoushanensis]